MSGYNKKTAGLGPAVFYSLLIVVANYSATVVSTAAVSAAALSEASVSTTAVSVAVVSAASALAVLLPQDANEKLRTLKLTFSFSLLFKSVKQSVVY